MSDDPGPEFTVMVFDLAHMGEPGAEHLVHGFATLDLATAYAIARVRSSVEALRKPDIPSADLRRLWSIYGEDCTVLDSPVRGSDLLDIFIETPATFAESDWQALEPRSRRFRAMLLIGNADNETVWSGGFYSSTWRLTKQGFLDRFGADATEKFIEKGIEPSVPVDVHVAHHFELPDPPRPPASDVRPLISWQVYVYFVCHDVKFGGDAKGVFAWPEEPKDRALAAMVHVLLADTMAWRGDGPDWARDCDVNTVKVTQSDEAVEYPLD